MVSLNRTMRPYRPTPEFLEARRLLASSVTSTPAIAPAGLGADPTGELWWTEPTAGTLVRRNPDGRTFEVPLTDPGSEPENIAYLPAAAAMVFNEAGTHKIGLAFQGEPGSIPDHVAEFSLPTPTAVPSALAVVSTNDVWFVETLPGGGSKLGEFSSLGVILEFDLPAGARVVSLSAGPDANPWFVDAGHNAIGTMTHAGFVTEYPVPTPNAGLNGITLGSDGALWFTEGAAGQVGRITANGTATEYPLAAGSAPSSIAAGPDGNLWVTETTTSGPALARVSAVDGSASVIPLPAGFVGPTAIAPDGLDALAFADPAGNLVGLATTDPALGHETYTFPPQELDAFAGFPTSPFQPLVTFTTSISHSSAEDFTATIDWGDGSPLATGTVSAPSFYPYFIDPTPTQFHSFNVDGGHTYAQAGAYTVHVSITDLGGETASTVVTARVSKPPISVVGTTIDVATNAPFAGTVGDINLAPGQDSLDKDYQASIDWGDGTTTSGEVLQLDHVYPSFQSSQSNDSLSIYGNHTYAAAGDYSIRLTLTDVEGDTAVGTSIAHVTTFAPFTLNRRYPAAIANSPASDLSLANATINTPGASMGDYVATVDWGDGTSSTARTQAVTYPLDRNTISFDVLDDHEYPHAGIYSYTVTLTKTSDGSATTVEGTLNVYDAAQFAIYPYYPGHVPTTAGVSSYFSLPTITTYNLDAKPGDFTSVVDWGDGTASTTSDLSIDTTSTNRSSPPELDFRSIVPHTFAAPGDYLVTVTITQADGKTSQAFLTAIVQEPTPSVLPPADPTLNPPTMGPSPTSPSTPTSTTAPTGPPAPAAASPVVRPLGVSHLANTPFPLQARYDGERLLAALHPKKIVTHHAKAHPKPIVHRGSRTPHARILDPKSQKVGSHARHRAL